MYVVHYFSLSPPHVWLLNFTPTPPHPLVCVGLTSVGHGQGEAQGLDWLEVEESGSDWLNSFFTFLYCLINPLEEEDEDRGTSRRVLKTDEEDEGSEDEEEVQQRSGKDDGNKGQKIVIVGLHNQ